MKVKRKFWIKNKNQILYFLRSKELETTETELVAIAIE
jgi:hypothetical protein